ncbi:hypothetical protein WT83_28900 [Burkholderia territorii]|uniref:Uncharacterized protein n=1 Tax=Burkholderia territorii TaxID=1503055 RepID=A0A108E6H3_9BURK|nr:phage integrase family protein [Burkholderia territorii]KWN05586.1 hypothetical protein WT83_28900 [Burkholderia territorii]
MTPSAEQLTLTAPYTRSDFAALRAWVQRVPLSALAVRYDDPDTTPYEDALATLERHLKMMRDDLVHLALLNSTSALAEHLKTSICQHGHARLTAISLKMVEAAGPLAAAAPAADHAVSLCFRPPIAWQLAGEGGATLGDLIAFCNARGGCWWRRLLVAWLRIHAASLSTTIVADVLMTELLASVSAASVALVLPDLSGARSTNRAAGRCYLHVAHNLDAPRAYTRELELLLRAATAKQERLDGARPRSITLGWATRDYAAALTAGVGMRRGRTIADGAIASAQGVVSTRRNRGA